MFCNALFNVLNFHKHVFLSQIESGIIVAVNALRIGSFSADCQLTVISTKYNILLKALIVNVLRFAVLF